MPYLFRRHEQYLHCTLRRHLPKRLQITGFLSAAGHSRKRRREKLQYAHTISSDRKRNQLQYLYQGFLGCDQRDRYDHSGSECLPRCFWLRGKYCGLQLLFRHDAGRRCRGSHDFNRRNFGADFALHSGQLATGLSHRGTIEYRDGIRGKYQRCSFRRCWYQRRFSGYRHDR